MKTLNQRVSSLENRFDGLDSKLTILMTSTENLNRTLQSMGGSAVQPEVAQTKPKDMNTAKTEKRVLENVTEFEVLQTPKGYILKSTIGTEQFSDLKNREILKPFPATIKDKTTGKIINLTTSTGKWKWVNFIPADQFGNLEMYAKNNKINLTVSQPQPKEASTPAQQG